MAESGILTKAINTTFSDYFVRCADSIHCYSLEGRGFFVGRSTSVLGNSSWMDIQLNVSTSCNTILGKSYFSNSRSLGRMRIFEATTNTTAATGSASMTLYNRNRNSTITVNNTAFSDPEDITSSTFATLLDFYFGSTLIYVPGELELNCGIVLKQNTTYYVRLENLSGNNSYASMYLCLDEAI